jgi:cytidylate kinase
MTARKLIIAIDGPSGAGKGTISRTVSEQLGYRHIDTGAMYRAVGWKANHDGLSLDDEMQVSALARRANLIVEGGVVSIDGHDVTKAIRTPDVDRIASIVARLPKVREVLVARQRELGAQGGVVMEGRDIGTVVFPSADVKIYLDASGRSGRAAAPATWRIRATRQGRRPSPKPSRPGTRPTGPARPHR